MKKPYSDKTPAMQDALKGMFPEQAKNIAEKKCATCGSTKISHEDFENELSRKEYAISGMCQVCQNSVFKEPSEENEQALWDNHIKNCKDPTCGCKHV